MRALSIGRIVFEGLERGSSLKDICKATGLTEKSLQTLCSSLRFTIAANDSDIDDYLEFLENWEAEHPGALSSSSAMTTSISDANPKLSANARAGSEDLRARSAFLQADPEIGSLVASVFELASQLDPEDSTKADEPDADEWAQMHAIVETLIEERLHRSRYLPNNLLGEPAWDMLLDLFQNRRTGTWISVKSLCVASGAPETTAKRYIQLLEDKHLISSRTDPSDGRVRLVALSLEGVSVMASLLRGIYHF